jgi:hypothetical protein
MRENGSENLRGDHWGPVHQDQERKPSTAPSNPIQNASLKSRQNHRSNQPPPGSTRRPKGYESKLKFKYRLSQSR